MQLLLGGSALAHPVANFITAADITAGSVSLTVTAGDLGADGSKSITAQFSDVAGNTSTTAADVITLDTTAPGVAIVNPGGATNQPSLSVTGTITGADAGTTIAVFDGTTQVGVGTISGGTWSANVTLGNGSNVLTAEVTDAAGNTAISGPVTYTLNTTAPTGGTPALTAASDSGTSQSDDITDVTAPTFTVALGSTVVAGDTVQLLLGGVGMENPVTHTVTAADITAGSVSLTVTAGDLGADGTKQNLGAARRCLWQQLDHRGTDHHARHHRADRRHAGSHDGVGFRAAERRDHRRDGTDLHGGAGSGGGGRRHRAIAAGRIGAGPSGHPYHHRSRHHRRQRRPDGDRRRPRGRWLEVDHGAVQRRRRQHLDHRRRRHHAGYHGAGVAIGNPGGATNQPSLSVTGTITGAALQGVHNMSGELRPNTLDDLGLVAALKKYAADFQAKNAVNVDLQVGQAANRRFKPEVETAAYRIAQEALANVVRPLSGAKNVSIVVDFQESRFKLIVEDDGKGFNLDEALKSSPEHRLGLFGMYERASLIGGSLAVESQPGQGTSVYLEVPVTEVGEVR